MAAAIREQAQATGSFSRHTSHRFLAGGGFAHSDAWNLRADGWFMDIEDWRDKIDEIDRKLVQLLSERTKAALAIGGIKSQRNMPVYEPDRERQVFDNVQAANQGPLRGTDLVRIYERIIDVMRNIQKEEIVASPRPVEAETDLDGTD